MRTFFIQSLFALLLLMGSWRSQAQTTVTIQATGTTGSYNVGSVSSAGTKYDSNMVTINSGANRGFAKFNLSSIPAGAVISAASVTFVTYSSTSSSAANNIYGFTGDPATIAGATLYTNCGAGTAFSSVAWTANASNTLSLNAAGISFLTSNITSTQLCLGFVRGSTNTYNIAGYAGGNGATPSLSITYTVPTAPPPCATYVTPANAATGLFSPVTLRWNASLGATGYDVYYGTTSNPTTLAGTVTDTTYSLGSLAVNTTYYWKVVPKNSLGSAAGCTVRSFTTSILSCVPTYANGGTTDNIAQVTLGTLSDVPPTNNSPYYFDRTGVQNAIPDIPQTVPTTLSLTFGSDGNQYNGVWIDFNNNGNFETTEFFSSNSNPGSSGTASVVITIPATASLGNVYMRIRGGDDAQPTNAQPCNASGSSYGMGLDYKVNITAAPACIQPATTTFSNVAAQSVTLSWAAAASAANGYEYYINLSNTPPTAGTTATGSVGAGITTVNVTTGITPNATHYYWVRSLCAGGAKSGWSTIGSFTTPCLPVTVLPWTENFDALSTVGATNFPSCWKKQNGDWETTNEVAGTYFAGPYSGANALRNRWSADKEFMWTPGFQLTAGTSYDFSFYWAGDNYSGWQGDVYRNGIQDSTGAVTMGASFVTTGTTTNMTYQKVTRTFIPTTSGTYYFAIRVNESTGAPWYLGFDNFELRQTPTCFDPQSLTANLATATSASLSWTAPTPAPAQGYQYYYNTTGVAPTATSTPVYNVPTGTTASVSPLAANTTYYFWVRSVCSGTDKSPWSNMASVTTNYCTPAPVSVDDQGIINVISGSFSNPTVAETNNYGNYTNLSINGPQGQQKNMKIVFSTLTYDYNAVIYVDWNNDFDFNDPDETVFTGLSAGSGGTDTVNASFVVPATATLGAHRMRIGGADAATPSPCYTGAYGTIEDYTLNVVSCAGLAVSLGNDTTICGSGSLTLNAANAGASYLWSNGATTQTISPSIGGNYSVTVTIANGCAKSDTIAVAFSALPTVALGPDAPICSGGSKTLNAGNPGNTYLWSTGATTQTISVTTPGTYWAKVTNIYGCWSTDTIVLTTGTLPTVSLGNDTGICANASITLDAGNAGSTYLWNGGATTQTITATTQGAYSVTVTNPAGCSKADTINISINALPVVALGNDTAICADDTLTLDAGNAGATYLWSNSATTQTIGVSAAGSYHVMVTSAAGCSASDTMNLTTNPLPSADAITVTGTSPSFTFTVTNGQNVLSYLWNFGDNTSTSTSTSPVHSYAAAGTYTVTVTLTNDCGSTTLTKQVTVQGNGVHDLDLDEAALKLYPNPANQSIVVDNESSMHLQEIQVYNVLGQLVATHKATHPNGKQVINVSNLANGMYHMRIRFTEGTAERKFEILK